MPASFTFLDLLLAAFVGGFVTFWLIVFGYSIEEKE